MRTFLIIISLFAALLMVSCSKKIRSVRVPVSSVPEKTSTTAGPPPSAQPRKELDKTYNETADDEPKLKVPMAPGTFLITVVQTNLDLDTEDEQIVVYKKSKGDNDPIIVAVADYDSIRNKYVISWSHETDATNVRSFNLSLIDVTGDHNLEIVCSGSDGNSNQTLNIYKRSTQTAEYGLLTFKPILSLKEKGNIEIQEEQRSQAYRTGVSNGKSFPVIATVSAANSGKRFDLIRKTYFWRNEENKYQLINTETIPGKEIEDKKLRKLLSGTKTSFEKFLSSLWLYSTAKKNDNAAGPIVLFNPRLKRITFYNNDIEEIYRWESSTKTLYNTLIINCRNDIVPYLRVTLFIRIVDLNTIRLVYKDDNIRNSKKATNKSWSGKYLKTDQTMENYLFAPVYPGGKTSRTIHLTGYYKSGTGNELFFDPPRFELKTSEGNFHGGFYLYNVGTDILQLKFINDEQKVYKIKTYKYDFLVTKNKRDIVRALVLIPGSIDVRGFLPSGKTFQRYEQIEQLEQKKN